MTLIIFNLAYEPIIIKVRNFKELIYAASRYK